MGDVTWVVHRTLRCANLQVVAEQWVRAPADTLDFWNRIDEHRWQALESRGDPTCDGDLVTVDLYARIVAPRG